MRRLLIASFAFSLLASSLPAVHAQEAYPNRPIKVVNSAGPGSSGDVVARWVTTKLSAALGQPVVVENRPGAAMTVGVKAALQAAPDGYTLLWTLSTPMTLVPLTQKFANYEPLKDFVPISSVASLPLVLYVNGKSNLRNLADVVNALKSDPNSSMSHYGNGSGSHLMNELLANKAGAKPIQVAHKSIPAAVQDLIGGRITTAIGDPGSLLGLVKDGSLRAVAVASNKRVLSLPDVPTFAEQGMSGFDVFAFWYGLYAPAGTPKPIVDRLSNETIKAVAAPDVTARLIETGNIPGGTSPEATSAQIKSDIEAWKSTLKGLPHINFQ